MLEIELKLYKIFAQEEKGIGKQHRTAKVGGWQNNFTEKEKNLINTILGKTLTKLGYVI